MPARPLGPALTADAVWIDHARILLVRRGRPPFRGRWALPGGFVELEETVEQAVARELREETGLRARPLDIVGVYPGPAGTLADRPPRSPTSWSGGPEPRAGGDDAQEAAWVPLAEAHGLAFDHDEILRDGQALARRRSKRNSA